MQNYSQTYAANIATFAGVLSVLLRAFNVEFLPGELEVLLGSGVAFLGFVWQFVQRFRKGDVTFLGFRR